MSITENSQLLKEILNALSDHSNQINKRFEDIDKRFEAIDKCFDNLEKKVDGIRVDLSETQETTNFLLSEAAHQDKKIRNMN